MNKLTHIGASFAPVFARCTRRVGNEKASCRLAEHFSKPVAVLNMQGEHFLEPL
jgi:hypothetical protein